jgi:hypothetical protein
LYVPGKIVNPDKVCCVSPDKAFLCIHDSAELSSVHRL